VKLDVRVRTDNIQALVANFYGRDVVFQRKVRALNREYAEYVRDVAEQLAPKDTTFMARHIRKDFSEDHLRWSVGYREEDFTSKGLFPYYLVQELGGAYQEAQPHLFPAYREMAPHYTEDLSALLKRTIAEGRDG
jgi:HK97 gp10 family phage protein